MRRARRESPGNWRVDQDLGISREEPRAPGARGQSGQGLPAARRSVRRRRLREDHVIRAWLAGLRRLLSLASLPPLQGAGLGGLFVDDGGRGRVRRPQQHDRRPRQHDRALFAQDDRGLDDLHGRSHRRRPAELHRERARQGFGRGRLPGSLCAYPCLRWQPHRRLRQHDQGRAGELLEEQDARTQREDQHHSGLRRFLCRQQPRIEAAAR